MGRFGPEGIIDFMEFTFYPIKKMAKLDPIKHEKRGVWVVAQTDLLDLSLSQR